MAASTASTVDLPRSLSSIDLLTVNAHSTIASFSTHLPSSPIDTRVWDKNPGWVGVARRPVSLFDGRAVQTTLQVNGVSIGSDNADAIVNSGTVYMVLVDAVTAADFASIPG
ncbi:BQ5605_C039g11824 [Microbotryum silenes-dioicae]|uniref:BQ5605_C039g11824 protein n=1 Tax=Microbotryum silenes-dioicae TaxID=796604 RepID=A0A2X0PFU4_9BASI|nr:BQ5605_C039g11824 [Microbotryum silenes-dioicae]